MQMNSALNDYDKFEQVVQKIHPHNKLLRTWKLQGGVSAQITALEVERADGQTQKMLVRQHGERDLAYNPQIAADEFKLLRLLHTIGLATPVPYYLDQSGTIFATPYIVIEYIEGETECAPSNLPDFLRQFATHLARIHQIDGTKLDLSFLPHIAERYATELQKRPPNVDETLNEGRIR